MDFWREIRTPSLASHPSLPPHTRGRCSSAPAQPPWSPRGSHQLPASAVREGGLVHLTTSCSAFGTETCQPVSIINSPCSGLLWHADSRAARGREWLMHPVQITSPRPFNSIKESIAIFLVRSSLSVVHVILRICIALYSFKSTDHITFRFLCSALTLVPLKSCSRTPKGPA